MIESITPDWPAPPTVRALSTSRVGGVSDGKWASLNLGAACGDRDANVIRNRLSLRDAGAPEAISWLRQVHGSRVVSAESAVDTPAADACIATTPDVACAVLHADCLPVLICDRAGAAVAAVHAGWRGLAAGVLRAAVEAFPVSSANLLAWLGPCIGQTEYEVGTEVREAVRGQVSDAARHFSANPAGRLQFDLSGAARSALADVGVRECYGGSWCTASDPDRFFSYRRDTTTGRMATLIWLTAD